MAKLFAASGMYAIPEILCIKGTRWHEVIQEKKVKKNNNKRMPQHDNL